MNYERLIHEQKQKLITSRYDIRAQEEVVTAARAAWEAAIWQQRSMEELEVERVRFLQEHGVNVRWDSAEERWDFTE